MVAAGAGLLFTARLHCSRGRMVRDRARTTTLDHLRVYADARCRDADARTDSTIYYVHHCLSVACSHCDLLTSAPVHGNAATLDQARNVQKGAGLAMLGTLLAAVILAALVLYALMGGADYGGGIWGFFFSRPPAQRQPPALVGATPPRWGAKHVLFGLCIFFFFLGVFRAFF